MAKRVKGPAASSAGDSFTSRRVTTWRRLNHRHWLAAMPPDEDREFSVNQHTPIIPLNSALGRSQKEPRSSVRVVVVVVLAFHLVLLAGLLIQGCKHSEPTNETTSVNPTNALPPPSSNAPVVAAPTVETNLLPPVEKPSQPGRMEPPASPSTTKRYSVVKGDSFYRIAHANGIPMRALTDANPGVDSAKLKVGQVLQLPPIAATVTATASAAATPTPRTTSQNHNPNTYVVRSGETLARIAKAHGTSIRAIRAINQLKSDRIVIGQKLKLPETNTAG